MSTIPANDWIAHHARFVPNNEAMHDLTSDRHFTYAEMNLRVDRAALYLRDGLGVQDGDRVAVLCHNDTDMFEIQFACRRLGAIFLPLNWRLAVPELEYICQDATPRALIYGSEFVAEAAEIQRLAEVPVIAGLNNGGDSDYESGLAAASGTIVPPLRELDDIWTVMYTSGTTGRPKGAKITYQMAVYNSIQCAMTVEITNHSKNLVLLPIFHTGGLNVYANPMFHTGGTNVVLREFDPGYFLALLSDKALNITHLLGVPTNFLMLAQEPGFAAADLSHIVCIGVGGAAAPLSLIEDFGDKGINLQQGWGMTETGPLGLMLSGDQAVSRVGSSGLPPLYVGLRIVDESEQDVTQGETGELLIKAPTVTPGYWNREAEHDDFYTPDGWFRTGDAARQDEDGYYYIVDRTKDMFISGGENVYPVEVENVIFQLDGVLENAVIGIPDEKWGEVGRACVVLKPGANLDESAVIDHCGSQLARFKVPKQVRFMDELPHNATGKVLKHELPRD
ncbi:MAG: long-chain fatty acid--CoA ligase [Rhodospirillaceae bacterium]|jgi:fatty-acyl-CoA synthase|nr:long-chain fatty acid--CoA ligase [Rhodospirillaceae bacterium]MBT3492693.1 long-chain fatty acid--CoA ligase [Rhodospirillaceae bacterium]MBT3779612.1 long-chain fatty acid--CoA ligase [Rhodospirillaceae bacterium]MBT3975905.1 long-chain fatty acid--CoA ligase [Rhodospirillaceae bacterium]MBT4168385.1 long-chain fatty acid--CoA ligase [Rhodospirillaceae bacterium]